MNRKQFQMIADSLKLKGAMRSAVSLVILREVTPYRAAKLWFPERDYDMSPNVAKVVKRVRERYELCIWVVHHGDAKQ